MIFQLDNLHEHTDTQILVIAVRSKVDQYNAPYIFYTDDRIPAFLELKTGGASTIQSFALELEGYLVSGINCELFFFFCIPALTPFTSCDAKPSWSTVGLEEAHRSIDHAVPP